MSTWVRRKDALRPLEDGQLCIAGPDGPIHRTVIDGAFEWPDEAGAIHGGLEVTEPSPEARERRRLEELALLEAEAARLGFRLAQLRGEDPAPAPAPEPTPVAAPSPPPAPEKPRLTVRPAAPVANADPGIQASSRRAAMAQTHR